jgi:aminoglycoside phosphotransferase (APT) family kinase protein
VDADAAIEHAVAALEPGGRLLEARALTGGVSAEVVGLTIATSRGTVRRVVFRRHRETDFKQHARRVTAMEHAVLSVLHRDGFAVPEPYLIVDTGTAPYLVIQWIDGSTELGPDRVPAAMEQMARFLAQLHAVPADTVAAAGLEHLEDPAEAVVPFLPPTDIGERVRAALATGTCERDATRPVLLHGDYWPGNVMWRDGVLVAVVDWEDARLGDPLADLATARVELLCQHGAEAMEQFTAHYLARREDAGDPPRLDGLSLWEVYVSAAALATMHAWNLAPAEEARRRQHTEAFFARAAHAFVESRRRSPGVPERVSRRGASDVGAVGQVRDPHAP